MCYWIPNPDGRHIMPFPGQDLPVCRDLKVLGYSMPQVAAKRPGPAGTVRQENRFMTEPAGVFGSKFTVCEI